MMALLVIGFTGLYRKTAICRMFYVRQSTAKGRYFIVGTKTQVRYLHTSGGFRNALDLVGIPFKMGRHKPCRSRLEPGGASKGLPLSVTQHSILTALTDDPIKADMLGRFNSAYIRMQF